MTLLLLQSGPGSTARTSPPVNTVLPVISGTATVGSTLTTTTGTWTGTGISYSYQWKRSGANIGGATSNSYLLVSADLGTATTATVTATNAGGSASATSAAVVAAVARSAMLLSSFVNSSGTTRAGNVDGVMVNL